MLSSSMSFKKVENYDVKELEVMKTLGYGISMPEEWLFLSDV
jgi:hypothetical protein